MKITIITKSGKYIKRNATVTDMIDSNGNQYSVATVGRAMYRVIERNFDGAIFAACK